MLGSLYLELLTGLALLAFVAVSWVYLLRASRRPVPPFILRSNFGGEVAAISEIALLAFGVAAVIDFFAKVTG